MHRTNEFDAANPTNESKQLSVAFLEGGVGETYVKMAFQPHTTDRRQLTLCGKAEFWLQKALPEVLQRKGLLKGDSATDFRSRCSKQSIAAAIIFRKGERHQKPPATKIASHSQKCRMEVPWLCLRQRYLPAIGWKTTSY